MLKQLNDKNPFLPRPIRSIHDPAFLPYGRVLTGYDFSDLIEYMCDHTDIPENGNIYIPSDSKMESSPIAQHLSASFYGNMPIQIGYCNGKNSSLNGLEYHKGSEINIAVTDFMLMLGHVWDIRNNTYQATDVDVFFVARGEAFEMYQTTLHLSPCKVSDAGFKDIIILPQGTNTPLSSRVASVDPEAQLLLQRNKWVLAHPTREPLMRQGAHPGILGDNWSLHY